MVDEQTTAGADPAEPGKDMTIVTEVDIIMNLEQSIQTNIAALERLNTERKQQKEMIDSVILNDETYRQQDQAVKDATKAKKEIAAKIMRSDANFELKEKLKTTTAEIKERKAALSDYLLEYKRLSGATQLSLLDGSEMEIVLTAKAIKAGKKRK